MYLLSAFSVVQWDQRISGIGFEEAKLRDP